MSKIKLNQDEILGLDVGQARVGVARVNLIAKIPEPLEILANNDQLFENIIKIVADNQANVVVVGLPRNLSGQVTKQSKIIRDWAREFSKYLPKEVKLVFSDETLSSVTARQANKKAKHIDDLAACDILEGYLKGLE